MPFSAFFTARPCPPRGSWIGGALGRLAPGSGGSLAARLAALLAALLIGGCEAPGGPGHEVLRVGSDLDNPPFAEVDGSGVPRGHDVELMERLAARLGRQLEWVRMDFDALLEAAEAGRVDVVCATLGVTPEREQRIDFTEPYFETRIAAVVRAGAGEPTQLEDLQRATVYAGAGTTSELAATERLPGARVIRASKPDAGTVERLLAGEFEAAIVDGPNADRWVAERPTELALVPESLSLERYALAVRPDAPELLGELNAALEHFRGAGFLTLLDARYGLR